MNKTIYGNEAYKATEGKDKNHINVCPGGSNAIKVGDKIMKAPNSVIEFTQNWDRRKDGHPFTFTLEY